MGEGLPELGNVEVTLDRILRLQYLCVLYPDTVEIINEPLPKMPENLTSVTLAKPQVTDIEGHSIGPNRSIPTILPPPSEEVVILVSMGD